MHIYHGSSEIVRIPKFGAGRKNNDYGRGFYCTEEAELAKEWACSSLHDGFANHYVLDMTDLRVLNLNAEEYNILNWMAVLVENTLFRIDTPVAGRAKKYLRENFYVNVDAYDIVRGYRADDAYFDFADAFLNNAITVEQLSAAMHLGNLGEQIVLKSQLAFDSIRFEDFEAADSSLYYSKRKARNSKAETEFLKISEESSDGLYMIDIIRNEVKSDDARLR